MESPMLGTLIVCFSNRNDVLVNIVRCDRLARRGASRKRTCFSELDIMVIAIAEDVVYLKREEARGVVRDVSQGDG